MAFYSRYALTLASQTELASMVLASVLELQKGPRLLAYEFRTHLVQMVCTQNTSILINKKSALIKGLLHVKLEDEFGVSKNICIQTRGHSVGPDKR